MKSVEAWRPTKFVIEAGVLRPSADPAEVSPGSRLIADRVASFYDVSIPKYATGALLDLGCGKAPLYERYRPFASSVTLVDWGNSLHPNIHLDVTQDLNEPLEFPADSFDTVILSDVLEHIFNPPLLLGEISRVLKPGGTLIMNVPFMYWLHETPHDYYRYTKFALARMAEDVDLDVLHLEPIGGAPEVLSDILSKFLARVPVLGPLAATGLQRLTNFLCSSTPVRRISEKSASSFPLGYSMVARR